MMDAATQTAEQLRQQITATEEQLQKLKEQLASVETQNEAPGIETPLNDLSVQHPVTPGKWPLSSEEYKRYGRQMIVPNIGIQGQLRLKAASVLIVGAGGLGCPAAAYLAGAGVGTIGIVDGDEVETSNLHRQILHSTSKVGMKKVDSAISYLKSLNPNLKYNAHTSHLTPENSESIVSQYDLVLDCTDHPTSRYLISDICVLLQKPLVSASALRTDGQLIVLNSPSLPPGNEAGGPCYRCVFPKPPPAESVVSCGDGGILGPVVGVMGVLQALEAIKLIAGGKLKAEGSGEGKTDASMLLFSANSNPPFRSLRLRSRRPKCFACSAAAGLSLESLASGSLDYLLFCGVNAPVSILGPEERVEAREYETIRKEKGAGHLLVDTREKVQFDICNIEGSINVPISTLQGNRALAAEGELPSWLPETLPPDSPIYVVCRLGNDSQVVTRKLKESGLDKNGRYIGDIKGGLKAWKQQVDSSWPEY
ncbi:related to molybdenum cofactor biosynthetic protein [Phialocephala subalpina]|uniref:Adenylyltransferase and sulfurtransferase uba4 n=1 Tax=Phialocephala subalpina TaxID=576137 RepID=A0A1L7WE74_9HELO|nr:related to molybdenum cofactor biosynthetic protein [Phialocephala subalpina]